MAYQCSKETIWHFTCVYCNGFWSIATMDDWNPKGLYCPHCGKKNESSPPEQVLSESEQMMNELEPIPEQREGPVNIEAQVSEFANTSNQTQTELEDDWRRMDYEGGMDYSGAFESDIKE